MTRGFNNLVLGCLFPVCLVWPLLRRSQRILWYVTVRWQSYFPFLRFCFSILNGAFSSFMSHSYVFLIFCLTHLVLESFLCLVLDTCFVIVVIVVVACYPGFNSLKAGTYFTPILTGGLERFCIMWSCLEVPYSTIMNTIISDSGYCATSGARGLLIFFYLFIFLNNYYILFVFFL